MFIWYFLFYWSMNCLTIIILIINDFRLLFSYIFYFSTEMYKGLLVCLVFYLFLINFIDMLILMLNLLFYLFSLWDSTYFRCCLTFTTILTFWIAKLLYLFSYSTHNNCYLLRFIILSIVSSSFNWWHRASRWIWHILLLIPIYFNIDWRR